VQISPLGILLHNIEDLELLQAVSGDGPTALGKVRRPHSIALAPTINLLESAHSNSSPQVNLPRHGSFTIQKYMLKMLPSICLTIRQDVPSYVGFRKAHRNACEIYRFRAPTPKPHENSSKDRYSRSMQRTGSDVIPVGIIRSELLECCGLHNIGPYWDFDLHKIKKPKSSFQSKNLKNPNPQRSTFTIKSKPTAEKGFQTTHSQRKPAKPSSANHNSRPKIKSCNTTVSKKNFGYCYGGSVDCMSVSTLPCIYVCGHKTGSYKKADTIYHPT
jgi:hypothetical protein